MYGGTPYAGGAYAGAGMVAADVPVDVEPKSAVEVSFATDAFAPPVWVDISHDVRSWDVSRGRTKELERFQPGRLTVVLDNSDRDYDSQHATGPWFGNLRPMRRIRIRETFNGVTYPRFDGFVDSWNLDYPATGTDATAVVTATDAWKVFNRTDLGVSVYANEVQNDAPSLWWKTNEATAPALSALNWGSLGPAANGTYVTPRELGGEALVVNDPNGSMSSLGPVHEVNTTDGGVSVASGAFNLAGTASWAVECWVRPERSSGGAVFISYWRSATGPSVNATGAILRADATTGEKWVFQMLNTAPAEFGVQHATLAEPGKIYHVVCKLGPSNAMAIYVNGVKSTTSFGVLPTTFTGTQRTADLGFGYSQGGGFNPAALLSNLVVYRGTSGQDVLTDAQVSAHFATGSSPWQGDLPGARAARVLDLVGWPVALRELDAGVTTFQSATIDGQTALEHLQKVSESEAGNLFMNRAGFVRLVARAALLARAPVATFGDAGAEIGYRSVTFDDGFDSVRNRVTISRLNGIAKTAISQASIDEFGHLDFTLDGLLHDTDAHSQAYANFIRDNYPDPVRRVVALELGPAAAGNETALYEQMLGRELSDMITVKIRPPGGGAPFTQNVVIEGASDRWDPHGFRTATWTLAPAPTGSF